MDVLGERGEGGGDEGNYKEAGGLSNLILGWKIWGRFWISSENVSSHAGTEG